MMGVRQLPAREQFERFNLVMSPKSPMLAGRVKPVLLFNKTLAPCVFILMTESGNSPVKKIDSFTKKRGKSAHGCTADTCELVPREIKFRQINTMPE